MEQKFKVKFESRESYQEGVRSFMKLLDTWKSKESEFNRDFDLDTEVNDDENYYSLNVKLEVTEKPS